MAWTMNDRPRLNDSKQIDGVTYVVKSIWRGGVICNGEKTFTVDQWLAA